MCVGGGKLSRCIRNKRAGKISESTVAAPVCVCVCVFVSARVHVTVSRVRASEKESEGNKTVDLGDLSGETTHGESHLMMCKRMHALVQVESNTQNAHKRTNTALDYVDFLFFFPGKFQQALSYKCASDYVSV